MGGILSWWSTSKTQLPPNEDVKDEDPVLTRTLDFAWVTLATNDSYSLGALVLAHSLRNVNTTHKLAVLITPAVSPLMREQLSTVFDVVKVVDVLDSKDEAHLALMKRPELGVTFTKLHCWTLTEFQKCVFLDADTLVVKNCDELFEREELSAAPDVGWPDCFNTGVFVYKPSVETFSNLIKFSMEQGSFDGGDQGLLNQYFDDWATKDISKHLPFVYNLTSVAVYSYIPAFKHYGSDVRIVHFIGTGKPWLQQLNPSTRRVNPAPGAEHLAPLLQIWWDIFCEKVHPSMSTNLECDSGMRNDEIEACANDIPLETEPAEFIQPFTYYTDKDDSRQINLPYHPFDVKSSSGELLNITYLEQRERDILEELSSERDEEQEQDEPKENCSLAEYEETKEKEEELKEELKMCDNESKESENKEIGEIVVDSKADTETGNESPESQQIVNEQEKEEQKETAPPEEQSSFSTFFPDEVCVQNYLEKNFHTYQTQVSENKCTNIEAMQEIPPLPRFLTIAEDDERQRRNIFCEEPAPPSPQLTPTHNTMPTDCPLLEERVGEEIVKENLQENSNTSEVIPEVITEKFSPTLEDNLVSTKQAEEISSSKSCASLNIDPNKKYSMPKLKPLLPKQNVSYETVNETRQKITQYTEFHMNCDNEDFIPCDKLGFIERHILEEAKINEMDKDMRLKTLSYIFPQRKYYNKENKVDSVPRETFDEMRDYDLSLCQRQKGNQPAASANSKYYSRLNSCFLPVLKPLKPSKGAEIKRRSSSNGIKLKDKGTKAKVESRKAREMAKTEIKPSVQSNNVEDILKRLISFSKGYQKYFTGFTTEKQKSDVAATPNIINNGYNESSESPRLQYSKEFEDHVDIPFEKVFRCGVSPLLNGKSGKYNSKYSEAISSPVTGVIAKDEEAKVVEEVIVPKSVDLKFVEKPVTLTNGNGYGEERLGSKSLGRSKLTGGLISRENDLASGVRVNENKESTLVKEEKRTLQAVPTRSTKRKSKKRQRWSAVQKKDEVQSGVDMTVKTSLAPPLAREPIGEPSKALTLLSEGSSDGSTGKTESGTGRPGKTFLQSVRKKSGVTQKVKVVPRVDDSDTNNSGIAGAIAKLSLQPGGLPGTESEAACSVQEDYIRRQNWEMGTMDYMGRDSFNNIWSKICQTMDEKVPRDLGSDNESTKNKGITPPEQPKSDSLTPGNNQPDINPQKMTAGNKKSEETPPQTEEKVPGTTLESSSEKETSGADLSSKATQALEAFGKLFVSGPVAIPSGGSEQAPKPSDTNKSESQNVEKEQARSEEAPDQKKSIESGEEGKKKKSVLGKILELVGVEPSAEPKSVFYDTEDSTAKPHNIGGSVFYDTEDGQSSLGYLKVAEEVSTPLKQRSSSPSLQLKTTPDTEIVPPTPPPPTPQSGNIDKIPPKDNKLLVADETIMETPPVTDKKLLGDICDKEVVKSEVDNIIKTAVQCAEEQLNRASEAVVSKTEELSSLLPKANEALEAFGKLFVSGPVTIKSEVAEEVPKSVETPEKGGPAEKTSDEAEKDGSGKGNIIEAVQNIVSAEVTPKSSSECIDAEKTKQAEIDSTKSAEVAPKSEEIPQGVAKSEEPLAKAVPSEQPPDSKETDKEKPTEQMKSAEVAPKSEEIPQGVAKSEEPLAKAVHSEQPPDSKGTDKEKPTEQMKSAEVAPKSEEIPQGVAKSEEPLAKAVPSEQPPDSKETDKEKPTEQMKSAEVAPKSEEIPQGVAKSEEPLAKAVHSEQPPDSKGTDKEKPTEQPKPAEAIKEDSQIPVGSEKSSALTEMIAALPESIPDALKTPTEVSSEITSKLEELKSGASEKPDVQEKSPIPPESPVVPLGAIPDAAKSPEGEQQKVCVKTEEKPQEVCQKPDEAVPETSSKLPSGDTSDVAPLAKPAPQEDSLKKVQETSSTTPQVPPKPAEESRKDESVPSSSLLSKANEALEAFGRVFTSGPVVLKSDVPESPPEPTKQGEKAPLPPKEVTSNEPLAVFGKVFVSGPVTIKSEVEEADAVHPVFQKKPEEEPIYCNIDEVEELKVTSEEDRKKEKPQSSKLTEQILKAIPPQDRKPFTEASSVSSEVSQLLASIEPQNVSILLDKPMTDEMVTAEGGDDSPVPPVPPRKNKSKGKDAPLPPPKKKGKSDK